METQLPLWTQILIALGPTILVLIGGGVGWFVKRRSEELRAIELKLREERRKTYERILEPFVTIFAEKGASQNAIEQITSRDYRKAAFELVLVGSDDVVRAYNAFMEEAYRGEKAKDYQPNRIFRLLGELLLEIRKSVGSQNTGLQYLDMLRGMIKDVAANTGEM